MRVHAYNLATERGTTLRMVPRRVADARLAYPYEPAPPAEKVREPARVFTPRYVHACANQLWTMNLVNRNTGAVVVAPYRCRSWRCSATWVDKRTGQVTSCQRWKAAQNYARIREALKPYRARDIVFAVFTYEAPHGGDPQEAYDKLERGWPLLRKRLQRMFGAFDYVATVEVTRRGWPHLNLILVGDGVGRACTVHTHRGRDVYTIGPKVRRRLEWALADVGMGYVCTFERASSAAAISGYAVKVAGQWDKHEGQGTLAGEVIKLSQVPVNAKKGFRRLRASHGFLPKVFTQKSEWTGWLARADNGFPVLRGPPAVAFPDYVRDTPAFEAPANRIYTLRTARVRKDAGKGVNPCEGEPTREPEHGIVAHNTLSCSSVSSPTCAGSSSSYTFARMIDGVPETKAANAPPAPASPSGVSGYGVNKCLAGWSGSSASTSRPEVMASRCCLDSDSISSRRMVAAPRRGVACGIGVNVSGFAGCSCLGACGCTGPP